MTDRAITNNVLIVDEAGKPVGVTAGALNTSGAGAGAATIADGADVAQGTTTDAASVSTVIGLLKNLKAGVVANSTYVTTQVSVTGAAATLIASAAGRKMLLLQALAANTQSVWIGAATVTTVTGFELRPGAEKWFTAADVPVHLLQAISTSGTQTVVVTVSS